MATDSSARMSQISELALSRAWHNGVLTAPARTTDGRTVEIVHRGTWTHGFGPDFRDAFVVLDGRDLCAGSIELHLRTSAWLAHGHQTDPRYNDVVLHVVAHHDNAETRRQDGALVPVLVLDPDLVAAIPPAESGPVDWSRFGGASCAEELVRHAAADVRQLIWRLGDLRLAAKSARLEARLTGEAPGQILYEELWDGFGFAANRAPMRQLAQTLPLTLIEARLAAAPRHERGHLVRGLLFGVAGFLPLSPSEANFAGFTPAEVELLEAHWRNQAALWRGDVLTPTVWTRARTRPANHPAARLAAGAALLATTADSGLLAALLAPIRAGTDVVATLRDWVAGGSAVLGEGRAVALVANAVLPFALAYAEHTGDAALSDAAAHAWERLPAAEANEITRRTLRQVAGDAPLRRLGERGHQGLIQLDATLCTPRRCYECPIAQRVLSKDT